VSLTNGLRSSQTRMPNDMRTRAPLPTPSVSGNHSQNGHTRNLSGQTPFEMTARSPPNPSTKSMFVSSSLSFPPLSCPPLFLCEAVFGPVVRPAKLTESSSPTP
jgi:hypothetical protein